MRLGLRSWQRRACGGRTEGVRFDQWHRGVAQGERPTHMCGPQDENVGMLWRCEAKKEIESRNCKWRIVKMQSQRKQQRAKLRTESGARRQEKRHPSVPQGPAGVADSCGFD
eukprot:2177183-Pleurochrysis_carterae.AAC.2